jgi:hypothetical protein
MAVTHCKATAHDSNALVALPLAAGGFWDLVAEAFARLAATQDCGDHT